MTINISISSVTTTTAIPTDVISSTLPSSSSRSLEAVNNITSSTAHQNIQPLGLNNNLNIPTTTSTIIVTSSIKISNPKTKTQTKRLSKRPISPLSITIPNYHLSSLSSLSPRPSIQPFMASSLISLTPKIFTTLPDVSQLINLYPRAIPCGFTNLTTITVPLEAQILLSFGPNYCPVAPPTITDYFVALNQYHDTYLESHIDLGMYCRSELEEHHKFLQVMENHRTQTPFHKMLVHLFQITKQFLDINPNLLLVQSDKCKSTILIYKDEYMEKINNWLTNYIASGSCILYLGNTDILGRQIRGLFRRVARPLCALYVRNRTLFPNPIYVSLRKLLNETPTMPYLYGTIKTHKNDNPIRPICSPLHWYTSPLHTLCQYFLNPILKDRLSCHNISNLDHLTDHLLQLRPLP
ncbi:uncharacterized protein LOC119671129 [Teleopsis dalmanni]|uniref:uncharacterized protein LOC119671129 n=1 Tax=Teleopsis dalmanni TaxID=139649 RepID=UPI0018CED25A|nr:uncharacterized protein LOC119671129 [Teleopsis dalmanni]